MGHFKTTRQVGGGNLFVDFRGEEYDKPNDSMANGNCVEVGKTAGADSDSGVDAVLREHYAAANEIDESLKQQDAVAARVILGGLACAERLDLAA